MQDLTKILRIGQTVYCCILGEGKVLKLNTNFNCYTIVIEFSDKPETCRVSHYTFEGKFYSAGLVCLSPTPWPEAKPFKKKYYQPKFDEVVEVWDNEGDEKERMYFSHFDKYGYPVTFYGGRSSKTEQIDDIRTTWKYMRKLEE